MSKELEELIQSGRKRMGAASPVSRARVTARVASTTGAMLAVTGTAAGASAAAGASVTTGFAAPLAVKLAVAGVLAISAVGTGYLVTSGPGSTRSVSSRDAASEIAASDAHHTTLHAQTPESVEPSLVALEHAPAIEEEAPIVMAEEATSSTRRAAPRREPVIERVEPEVAPREEVAPPSLREALLALRAASDALARHDASQAISILGTSEIPASLVEQREGILTIARCRLSPLRRSELRAAFEAAYPRSPMGSRVRSECPIDSDGRTAVDSITE